SGHTSPLHMRRPYPATSAAPRASALRQSSGKCSSRYFAFSSAEEHFPEDCRRAEAMGAALVAG
ncbi:MAG: hypothetical protein J5960_09415, partial [Desulfovibrio sp.]|nr:hypothetical protein [Desulfovibrio sp.]